MKYIDAIRLFESELGQALEGDEELEARELLAYALKKDKAYLRLYPNNELSNEEEGLFLELMEKRKTGYPLQYILGEWEFYGIALRVGEGVLIPRADTEALVDLALSLDVIKNGGAKLLDLCSGSGAIPIAISKNASLARADAVELSEKAYFYLKENSKGTILCPILEDCLSFCPRTCYDVITCNPPYISFSERKSLKRELDFEPEMALTAKDEGLYFYKQIARRYKSYLNKGGYLIFEIGYNQKESVQNILLENGYKSVSTIKDLGGNDRVCFGRREG